MGSPADELVEVISADGEVERVVTRAEMRADNLRHRNIAVFVQRTDGRLVVHQRADWKDVHPSLWDVAFGGVPDVGESDLEAAIRELAEEAGLRVGPEQLLELGRLAQDTDATRWVGVFHVVVSDEPLAPADGEVVALEEVPVAGLFEWAAEHPLCPDVVPLLHHVEDWLG